MANRSDCYINDAYCGYCDSFEEISNFDSTDENEEEELYISENETFVDEDNEKYFRNKITKKYVPNKKSENISSNNRINYERSLISSSPIRKTPTTTSTPKKQIYKIGNRSMPIVPVRRCLDTKPVNQNHTINYYGGKSNSARNFTVSNNTRPNVTIRRSKSAVSIVKPTKMRNEKIVFSANNSFTAISPTRDDRPSNKKNYYVEKNTSIRRNISQQSESIFIRNPYNLNASVSSVQPLITESKIRNLAVISPTYSRKPDLSAFEISTRRTYSQNVTQSTISPSKTSWLEIPSQKIPICTLRTSAMVLLIAGTISCLLCFHIMSKNGKSYEITFSLISSFISLCLGFPCFRFQQWQWLPNRNYVSGYIILSLFSMLQASILWFLDHYSDISLEILYLTRGALCGISSLLFGISVLGICSSYCCKYPPPDNRVAHGVVGFTV